jgi:hypothetical protein
MSEQPTVRTTRAGELAVRLLGLALLLASVWRAVGDLTGPFRDYCALSFWLAAGAGAAVWLPCLLGGVALLRLREWGCYAVYTSLVLVLAGWIAPAVPLFRSVLQPRAFVWLFGGGSASLVLTLVAALVLVRAHSLVREVRPPAEHVSPRTRSRWLLSLPILAVLLIGILCGLGVVERQASAFAEEGNVAFEAGDPEGALARWAVVVVHYPRTRAWGVAVFNSGLAHRRQGRQAEAVAAFEMLLPSGVNDLEPGGNLMETYRNYRHSACVEIAGCYEDAGDYPAALRYLDLARNRYPFESWCLTCSMEVREELDRSTERVRQKMSASP